MKKRFNLSKRKNRLLKVVFLAQLFIIGYFILYAHQLLLDNSKSEILKRLKSIAFTSAQLIDGKAMDSLVMHYLEKDAITLNDQDKNYWKMHQNLRTIKELNGLNSAVYTMVYNKEKNIFEFIGSSSDYPYYRHEYRQYPQDLIENYNSGGVLKEYESENGTWLSAYAPIFHHQKVVGLIQIDESFDAIIEDAFDTLIRNVLLALLIVIPFSVLFFRYLSGSLKKEQQASDQLSEMNEELKTQSDIIKNNNEHLIEAQAIIREKNKELDTKVRKRTSELLHTNQELKNYLYRSSHDIQGPLATLKGLTSLLKNELTQESQVVFIEMFNQEITSLSNRIKGICSVYELKNAKKPKLEKVALKDAVKEVQSRMEMEKNGPKINWHTDKISDAFIISDKTIFTIVLEELLRTSLQARINFNSKAAVDFYFHDYIKGKDLFFNIRDCNNGITSDLLDYYKVRLEQNSAMLNVNGVGFHAVRLGLSILKGEIELLSGSGNRTEFELKLPLTLL